MPNKIISKNDELTCKPLDTYNEILSFLEDPPPWRTLCKELTPHSKSMIRNIDINKHFVGSLDAPKTFCHFDSDADDVKRHEEKKLPRTLVCHDMANGYHDDSIIDGTGKYDAYTFYNWAGIDIFCYFSHHLITIPPLAWINVGHDHGVKVIGTVITEWAEGVTFWDQVLSSEVEYQTFASALVAITKTLKFDGWLLNVENKISKPDVLLEFVRYLHRALHQELPHAELIWYDSVTVEGNLVWQNGLNKKNKAFFDACDGLFTNYSWSVSDVKSSVKAVGDRLADLYIGIDVWGRNFYGGGQFNTHEAIKVAHSHGCSLAIFAQAWTHEALSMEPGDPNSVAGAEDLDKLSQFHLRDRAFWGSVWQYLNTRLPATLPFQTSFCRGQGMKRRLYGEVLCPLPWYNLRHMQYQPNSSHGPHGYFLSTLENILQVSHHTTVKDTKGIIRYRESFKMSRIVLHSVQSKAGGITSKADSVTENKDNEEENEIKSDEEGNQIPNAKRKTKNPLEHCFKLKSQRTNDENDLKSKENDAGPSIVAERCTHLATVQVSANLKIGQREKVRYALARVPEEMECLQVYLDDSFIGGSCLRVHPSDELSPEHRLTRLFHCDFNVEEKLITCIVTKNLKGHEDQYLNVKLFMKTDRGEDLKVVLVGRDVPHLRHAGQKKSGVMNLYPLNVASDPEFRDLQKYLLLNESGFYIPVENSYGWVVRYYELTLPGSCVTSINLRTGLEQGSILLGHFGLCQRTEKPD